MSISGNWEKRRVGEIARLGSIDRRTFIKLSGASAAALIFGAGPSTEKAVAQPRFSDYPFSLGVTSGDPLSDGVVLWTRLAPDPLNGGGMPDKRIPVQWQVATDKSFGNIVQEGMEFARPELAHSVHVEVGGFSPRASTTIDSGRGPSSPPLGVPRPLRRRGPASRRSRLRSRRASSTSMATSRPTGTWPGRIST